MAEANQEFPTILGPDATFKGELSFEKGLRLHGRLEGKITTPGRLHVAKEAKLQADVEAGAIIIEGDVHGNLVANDRIEMKQTARYEGDLRASKLVVDEGAVFSGHVTVGPEAVKNRPAQGSGTPNMARPAVGGMSPAQPQPIK
ncbi:MAG: polymer-forming cytoskeletal protein [Phycisphaerales bacterium]|jgi:cytoskeletal protein CcmA (bactofilin family)|nr:polymer-forming cytoskeletal protein [Phycisphaerales bacterium]